MKLKFTTLFLSLVFLISAATVSAESVDYKKTISKVKTESVKNYEKTDLSYKQTLRRGVKNDNVYALQKKLKELGFYTKELDSDYGSGTLAAVKAFQTAYGLDPDGVAGPKTFAKILGSGNFTLPPEIIKDKPSFCTTEYSPVCGQIEVNCVKAPCPQPQKTFGNKCSLNAAGAKYLYGGECKTTKPVEEAFCTKEYNPVCGIKGSDIKTFSNKCLLRNSDYNYKYGGKCGENTLPDNGGNIKEAILKLEAEIKRMENTINEIEEKIKILKKEL